ncbi:hypothetical protein ACDA63_13825 [Uliginosibacterium sp. sgz301328]|uniref:hypothetical protein n=1 Tax=Uliginosibacterium sp. sgz301328 TaxID=3243764 RepID=UPI00359EB9CD
MTMRIQKSRIAYFSSILALIGLWMMSRPYRGIRHDGILYFAQAIEGQTGALSNDLFFSHGSQASFTLYPQLLGFVISHFGVSAGHSLLLALTLFLFVGASIFLLYPLLERRELWFGLVVIACLPHFYGSGRIFAFAEPFLTARSVAEPFALLGIGLALNKRPLESAVSLFFSLLMHPLVAIPAAVVSLILFVQHDRRWLALLLLGIPVVGLALAGIRPFSGLFAAFDPEWFSIVRQVNFQILVAEWAPYAWANEAVSFAVLGIAFMHAEGRLRRLIAAVLITAVACLLVSLICGDGLHSQLILQLQLWRAQWLVRFLALAIFPWLQIRLWLLGGTYRMTALLLLTGLMSANTVALAGTAVLGVALWCGAHYKNYRPDPAIYWSVIVGAPVALVVQAATSIGTLHDAFSHGGGPTLGAAVLSVPLIGLLFAASYWRLLTIRALSGLGAALLMFGAGAAVVDQRGGVDAMFDGTWATSIPFGGVIPPGSQVYWQDDSPVATWAVLHRPSYFSDSQGAGSLFNRGTAIEYSKRAESFATFEFGTTVCRQMNALNERQDSCAPDVDTTRALCDANPDLAYMVLSEPVVGLSFESQWRPESEPDRQYFLYSCKAI